jgi:hypothetical protein
MEKMHTHYLKRELHHHFVHTAKTKKQTSELQGFVVFESMIKIAMQLLPGIASQSHTHVQHGKNYLANDAGDF